MKQCDWVFGDYADYSFYDVHLFSDPFTSKQN